MRDTRFAVYGATGAPSFLAVRLSQVGTLASHTVSDDGNTLTATGTGALSVDGVDVAPDDLVLYAPTPATGLPGSSPVCLRSPRVLARAAPSSSTSSLVARGPVTCTESRTKVRRV